MPLVGAPAPRFTLNGKPPEVEPVLLGALGVPISGGAGNPEPVVVGLKPVCGAPPKIVRPPVVDPAKPHRTAMSWLNERQAWTTRASISTRCDLRANWRMGLTMGG